MSRPLTAYAASAWRTVMGHKIISIAVLALLVGGGYWHYQSVNAAASTQTKYVLTTVSRGTVIATVAGSGQVSSQNQVDIHPKVSGDVISVLVKNGDVVGNGQALAYLDSTDAQKAVRDAQANLQSAQISLQKLQEPADQLTLTQQQNAADSAKNNLSNEYDTAFNDISSAFLDLPSVMTGLNAVLFTYDRSLGNGNQQNIDYYKNTIEQYDTTTATAGKAGQYHDDAQNKYNDAKSAYDMVFAEYKTTSRTSDTAATEKLLGDTYKMTQQISDAVKAADNLIELYQDTMTSRNLTPISTSNTHLSNLSSYTNTVNGDLSSLSGSVNAIASDKQNITETQQSLQKTMSGADPLDVQSAQLNVTQRENALQDAKDTLADYTIRAPFAGAIGNVTITTGDSAGSGTAVATLIGSQQMADLSFNEVDAAKIKTGDKATITFDAISDLSITGEVADINPIGAVSQGVVSYDVKIVFDTQDPRVRAGMTVNATIQTDVHQNVLVVPSSAVKSVGGSSAVQAFNPPLTSTGGASGVASDVAPQNIPVTTGLSDDTNTEIVSGLTEGQQIVSKTTGGTAAKAPTTTTTNRGGGGFGGGGIRIP